MGNQMLLVGNVFVSKDYGIVNQERVGCGIGWANFAGLALNTYKPRKNGYLNNDESNNVLYAFRLFNNNETIILFELIIFYLLFNNLGDHSPQNATRRFKTKHS